MSFQQALKTIFFDFVGTLVNLNPNYDGALTYLYESMRKRGLISSFNDFSRTYDEVYLKYLAIRQTELHEVTNSIWLSEALNMLGMKTTPHDPELTEALEDYFLAFTAPAEVVPCAHDLLAALRNRYSIALVSNFTYAPIVYSLLKKFELEKYFNSIVVSHEVGFRKPHPQIFLSGLLTLNTRADETVMVGDTLKEDITGAKALGMKTILISPHSRSGKNYYEELDSSAPDIVIQSLCELEAIL